MRSFPGCYFSLQALRVCYPSLNDDNIYFKLNFDTFDAPRKSRNSEAGFGLCVASIKEFAKFS